MKQQIVDWTTIKRELHEELMAIANWWLTYARDAHNGGWYGSVDNHNVPCIDAAKGSVLHTRILWTFSSLYTYSGNQKFCEVADETYAYITNHFTDKLYGGLYWTINANGEPLATKKQVYATAFGIYALAAYHMASYNKHALQQAWDLFELLEEKAFDQKTGGYKEAFDQTWQPIADMRLSEKDDNVAKTMNTHLHVLEAYTLLYKRVRHPKLGTAIERLLSNFFAYFINPYSHHLQLFFDEEWQCKNKTISFGHDIEAAWLLHEAAEAINHNEWMIKTQANAINMAKAAQKGLDADGGLWYENDIDDTGLIKEKHWWPQAEAMVGFCAAWQCSGIEAFALNAARSWQFIKNNIKAPNGEWYWGITADGKPMEGYDKAGLWKCPYHNSRACLEMIQRINRTLQNTRH